jgi:hypothetical protein
MSDPEPIVEQTPAGSADDLMEAVDEGDLQMDYPLGTVNLKENQRSLFELHRWYNRGSLVIDPEWQRRYVWDRKRASRLIESFLINLPIPVIYLAGYEQAKYEVIDGLQRLTSIFDFFENKYPLTGLEYRTELNNLFFQDLTPELQRLLENETLRTFELAPTTPKDLMFLIFERLNTGGVALNDMEIRNCLYRGRLNTLIKEVTENDDFNSAISQRGLEKRMSDRMLVLRFLAFYQMTYLKARKGLKAFFNEFFSTYKNPTDEKLEEFRQKFKHAMKACYTVFGDKGFRLRKSSGTRTGEWAPRINATVFQVLSVCFTDYDLGSITRSADSIFESYIDLIATDSTWVDAVTTSTGDPNKIDYSFETWKQSLRKAVAKTAPNDSIRLFSRALKAELFSQNSMCHLCGQNIVMIDDAALDHVQQYWEGGRTIPENARLVHRHCNATRPRK